MTSDPQAAARPPGPPTAHRAPPFAGLGRGDLVLPLAALSAGLFLGLGDAWLHDLSNPAWLALMLVWPFAAILASAMRVVHHAECLAQRLGEPYGTLVLTLAVTGIEVAMISTLMLHGGGNPTLARDSMFAVVMVVLNGMVGLSLLLGALRHREQTYNLQGAGAYLSVIIPLAVLSLVLPDVTVSTLEKTFSPFQSVFIGAMSVALYGSFLFIQTTRHRVYFVDPDPGSDEAQGHAGSIPVHAGLLLAYLVAIILMAETLAAPVDYLIEDLHLPAALGGLVVASLVLAPEATGAVRAALGNRLQRAVNIALGSVLATIGLTVPAVLGVSLATGQRVELGLDDSGVVLLTLTLAVSILTFSATRTNILQGAVHLILLLAYLMLIFAP